MVLGAGLEPDLFSYEGSKSDARSMRIFGCDLREISHPIPYSLPTRAPINSSRWCVSNLKLESAQRCVRDAQPAMPLKFYLIRRQKLYSVVKPEWRLRLGRENGCNLPRIVAPREIGRRAPSQLV